MPYQSKVMLIGRCSSKFTQEPRKQKLKFEILHGLKEFLKYFFKFSLFSLTVLAQLCFI